MVTVFKYLQILSRQKINVTVSRQNINLLNTKFDTSKFLKTVIWKNAKIKMALWTPYWLFRGMSQNLHISQFLF